MTETTLVVLQQCYYVLIALWKKQSCRKTIQLFKLLQTYLTYKMCIWPDICGKLNTQFCF